MLFRIANTFTGSLDRLTGEEQKAVKNAAFNLQVNPEQPGLRMHRVDRARDPNFWSARVGSDIRIIVHRTGGSLLLCYADHHDKAYKWAERRKLETHPKTGAAQLVEVRETVREIVVPAYVEDAPAKRLPFVGAAESDLLDCGVPPEWLDDVRAADEDGILTLAEHLPEEAGEALLRLAVGEPPQPAPAVAVSDPFEHPDAQRRFRTMPDAAELKCALELGPSLLWMDTRLRRLTEEQYAALDMLEKEPRCLFGGAAGTGKTLLALEYARRAGRDGSKVLLVCKNLLLGHWLCKKAGNMEGVTAGAWYEIAKDLIMGGNDDSLKNEFQRQERELSGQGYTGQNKLYNELYPLYLESTLDKNEPPYDMLVVDEAQDLFKPHILNSFNLIVRGGLAGGRWTVFGDPLQSILDTVQFVAPFDGPHDVFSDPLHLSEPTEYLEKALSSYSKSFVKAKLTKNCRNTQSIAEKTAALTGFEKSPSIPNQETGFPVERRYWKTPSDLLQSLENRIDRLTTSEKVPIQNIVLLSPYKLKTSRLAGVERISRFPLTNISNAKNVAGAGELKFSNIKSFKGLESQVVIIVDIDRIDENEHRAFLYVAMSRARSLLILMIHENIREAVESHIGKD